MTTINILLNDTYFLQNFNSVGHPDGECIMGRDGDDAWEFESVEEANNTIAEHDELDGAKVVSYE